MTPHEPYSVADLISIMALLRSEEGCPWDREQTHHSIRKNVIEEAYEVADAIDRDDSAALCEELGDLLMQVVFHSRMSEEEGAFSFDDVVNGICRKLVFRHPHIFGDQQAENAQEVLALWETQKALEKGQTSAADTLRAVPESFPALMRSQKLLSRAARAGFSHPDATAAFSALKQALCQLEDTVNRQDESAYSEKMGDALFLAVELSRLLGMDAEECLAASCQEFTDRFVRMEELAEKKEIGIQSASEEQKLALWLEAKNKF